MANQLKSVWLIFLLIAAGVVLFFLSMGQNKTQDQPVVLQEIFNQKPATGAAAAVNSLVASADPVPPMAIVTSPEGGHEAGFSIQVYSFQDKARAEAALASLSNSGYKAFLMMSDLGEKGTWYRVRIIGIPNEAAAQKLLEEIRKNYKTGFIVKPKK